MAEGFAFGGGPLTEDKYLGDWLKWEEDARYSVSTALKMTSATDKEYPSGTVLKTDGAGGVTEVSGGTGAILGLLRNPVYVRAGESVPVSYIVRHAIIDTRGIRWASAGYANEAALITAINTAITAGTFVGIVYAKKG